VKLSNPLLQLIANWLFAPAPARIAELVFQPASGVQLDEGIQAINSLLQWDDERPMDAVMNAPRLFVSRACGNVIWAMQHWTGRDGEKGACKDPVDLMRYMALAELQYLSGPLRSSGGGAY